MATKSRSGSSGSYKSVGRTSDGVTILAPKAKATHFKKGEVRTIIKEVRRNSDTGRFVTTTAGKDRGPRKG